MKNVRFRRKIKQHHGEHPCATVSAADCNDPLLDLSSFLELVAQSEARGYLDCFLKMPITDLSSRAANFDDNIVADLPTRVPDDLPDFFKMLASGLARGFGPDGTFYPFSMFPGEIRAMIWENCLPSKIHLVAENIYEGEIDNRIRRLELVLSGARLPLGDAEQTYEIMFDCPPPSDLHVQLFNQGRAKPHHNRDCCDSAFFPTGFTATQKIPLIARVIWEAHDVARSRPQGRKAIDRAEELPIWLDVNTDKVLINTQYIPPRNQPGRALFGNGNNFLDVRTNRLFGMVDRNMVKVAIFADSFVRLPTKTYHRLANAERVDVVFGVLQFRGMSDNEAATTDLFGMFGEENMGIVPANDPSLMRKLFEAHRAFGAHASDEFFPRCRLWLRLWCMQYRPSDFDEYYHDVDTFAHDAMTACRQVLIQTPFDGPLDELNSLQWKLEVDEKFALTFQPVFLVHRCRDPVLIHAGLLAN